FFACGKLGGKLGGKGGKCVQKSDDFRLDLQRLFWVFRAWDWDWKLLQHRLSNRYRGSPNAFHQDVLLKILSHKVVKKLRVKQTGGYMNSIGPLMQRVLPFNIMKNITNTAFTRHNNCCFVELKRVRS